MKLDVESATWFYIMINKFMTLALEEAKKAYALGEIPVGCVIVKQDEVIASAHNLKETKKSITAHAELLAINLASNKLDNYHLDDCSIYVTLEPCPMCMSAIMQAHIKNVYFGAYEAQMGAGGSKINLFEYNFQNPRVNVYGGVLEEESKTLLQSFFQELRKR